MNEIMQINSDLSIKYKHHIWLKGLTEEPLCSICGDKLSNKKILSSAKSANTCSKECYTKYKKNLVVDEKDLEGITSLTREQRRELKKFSSDVTSYHRELISQYPHIEDILLCNKLKIHGLNDLPRCLFCHSPHDKITNQRIQDCCSDKCSNSYRFNKVSYSNIKEYYFSSGVPRKFIDNVEIHELAKIYNNKHRDINQCDCGEYFIDSCPNGCARRKHFENISSFSPEKFNDFIENGIFNIKKAMNYYRCSESTIRRNMTKFGILNRTNQTIEESVIEELGLSKFNDLIRNDRTLIYPKEIDILIPSSKFGIEYNGMMWHSDGNSKSSKLNIRGSKNRHVEKTNLVEDQGYQLFHIFECEWKDERHRDIWKSVVNSKIGKSKRIYARNCLVKEIDSKTCKEFENGNHLQGSGVAKIRIGLYHDSDLVSVMTFSKSRYDKKVEYELIRFCNKKDTTVVGGASKLLTFFERKYKPRSIVSFANRRWSQGNVYEKLGFEKIAFTSPNYFYFIPGENLLHSRVKFQKHKLKDKLNVYQEELSESENMFLNGYRKIYDCGNIKYVKNYNHF